jgi:hypothetical protein
MLVCVKLPMPVVSVERFAEIIAAKILVQVVFVHWSLSQHTDDNKAKPSATLKLALVQFVPAIFNSQYTDGLDEQSAAIGKDKRFISNPIRLNRSWGSTQTISRWVTGTTGSFLEDKIAGCEAEHSFPFQIICFHEAVEVKRYSYLCAQLINWPRIHKDVRGMDCAIHNFRDWYWHLYNKRSSGMQQAYFRSKLHSSTQLAKRSAFWRSLIWSRVSGVMWFCCGYDT